VELTCCDDNGVIPVRPTALIPKTTNGEMDPEEPTFIRPKPVIGRYEGERHLIILPSFIHGKGLFTANSIKNGEMIIEYAGEVRIKSCWH
jgi:hypothetical protein